MNDKVEIRGLQIPSRINRLDVPEPIVRVDEIGHVVFRRRDAESMGRFLSDFGFVRARATSDGTDYFRGCGPAPYCVEVIPSAEDAFVGVGYYANTHEDLEQLAEVEKSSIVPVEGPGGGRRVRIYDPDGVRIDVIHGQTMAVPREGRTVLLPVNTPECKRRVNATIRTPVEPTPVYRVGHHVLFTPDFRRKAHWYMHRLGYLPTDVLTDGEGEPVLAFFRLNRGDKPSDHHHLAIAASNHAALHHVSTEALDIDAIGQGQQFLMARGWKHYWGIGRHVLGSQIFDYWKDPAGDEWEHYADGDVMTSDFDTGYYLVDRGGLWAWGDDLPAVTRPPDDVVANSPQHMKSFMEAWLRAPRPWLV